MVNDKVKRKTSGPSYVSLRFKGLFIIITKREKKNTAITNKTFFKFFQKDFKKFFIILIKLITNIL